MRQNYALSNQRKAKETRRMKAARLLVFTLMMSVSFIFGMIVYAYGGDNKVEAANGDVLSQTDVVKTVVVTHGDTLWGIAADYAPAGEDVRAFIHEIKQLNRLQSSVLREGQQLILP